MCINVSCRNLRITWLNLLCLIVIFLALISSSQQRIVLEKVSTLFLASRPSGNTFIFPSNAVEASAYDPEYNFVYAVGKQYIRAVDLNNPRQPIEFANAEEIMSEFTGVRVCGNHIIVSAPNTEMPHLGRILIYDKITPQNRELMRAHSITVGSNPSEVAITYDCKTIIVPLEGKAYVVQQSRELIDPEAGVGIIHFPNGMASTDPYTNLPLYSYNRLDFTKFNLITEQLVNQGVRFIYRIKNNTISRDLEPEYVTISEDETMAYIVLQENNAVARMNITNITNPEIIDIVSFGYKNWNMSMFDASDMDGGINMRAHPVIGMYQPDQMTFKSIGGVPYLFTANEGSDKHYSEIGWTEIKRGKDFVRHGMITREASQPLVTELENDALLGRLEFTMDDGEFIYTGIYNKLYTFGGRSFSIFRASDMAMVYDSGEEIEKSHATFYPQLFNADSKRYMNTPEATKDLRSDNKGPECESIIVADFTPNKKLIFVGNERPGTINVYSITNNNVYEPQFESVNYGGEIVPGETWQEAYQNRRIGDIDPESLIYVPANNNPLGAPLLIVTGAVSGTISVYLVRDTATEVLVDRQETTPDILEIPTTPYQPESSSAREIFIERTIGPVRASCEADTMRYVKCRNFNKCVLRVYKCDGIDDCGDGTDEANCEEGVLNQIYMLCVAAVTLAAISIVISLLACCFLKKRSLSYEKYEMKSRV